MPLNYTLTASTNALGDGVLTLVFSVHVAPPVAARGGALTCVRNATACSGKPAAEK